MIMPCIYRVNIHSRAFSEEENSNDISSCYSLYEKDQIVASELEVSPDSWHTCRPRTVVTCRSSMITSLQ